MSAHQIEPFQTIAKDLLTAIDKAVQTKAETMCQVAAVKQTLDAQLNALVQDVVNLDPKLYLLYRSNSSHSVHVFPGFGLSFRSAGLKDCQYRLRILVKSPNDLTVTADASDFQQKNRFNVYQGALDVQEISTTIEESLLNWLDRIRKSLT